MNDAYYTQTGERPDLASVEVNAPEGYIGTKLSPIVPVADKSGIVYYFDKQADGTAETDRSAGSGPDSTQISGASTSMTCTELAMRGKITPDEAKTMGGIEKADMVGARFAKRAVMNALEKAIAEQILGTADETFDEAKFLDQVQTGFDTIRLYEGPVALVGGTITLKRIVRKMLASSSMGPVFSRLISGGSPAQAATGMNFQAWMNGLAMFLGVDQVLAGDDTAWAASGTTAEKVGLIKLDPDPTDVLSHKWRAVYGKTYMFMPDGKNPWVIQSVADRVNVNNLYDAYIWYDLLEFNSTAVYVFDGIAA